MIIKHLIEYIILLFFCTIVRMLPIKISFFIMDRIADLIFFVLRIRVKVVLENLKIAFGSTKSSKELYDIAHKVYRNFGRTVIEIVVLPTYSLEKVKSMVRINNIQCLDKVLSRKKGGIIVSGHLGNWELLGTAIFALGYPISFVIGEQRNKFADKLLNNYRSKNGIKLIPRQFSLKGVLKVLKNNEFVALLSDQNAGGGGVFVNFFGKLASTPGGAALFSLKSGGAIILAIDIPNKDRSYHNIFFEEVTAELTGQKEQDVFLLTQAFTKRLENWIIKFPEHYFWLHKRWKTRPKEELK
ncbi:MAG: lysophospholipid acyltransferase family protein [Endomicrobiia bacterium]